MRPYSPGGVLNALASAREGSIPPTPSTHRLQRGLPGYLIPFAPTLSRLSVSHRPEDRLRTGVPPDLYTFHRYTGNSIFLSGTQEKQSRAQFLGWAEGFHTRLTSPPTRPLRPVIPSNACHLRITAAAGTELAVASSEGTVKYRRYLRRHPSFPLTGVYDPKAFVPHAASLRQAFAHCGRFPTAASRRSRGRVSVPVWPVILSDRLPIIALAGRYPAN